MPPHIETVQIVIPHLGQGIESAEVVLWYREEGDRVLKDDHLCELVTDKVSFQVPSPHTGVLSKKYLLESESAAIGSPLALITLT